MIKSYGVINDRSPHIIADLFEIMAVFERREISRSDIETYLINSGGAGLKAEVEQDDGADGSSSETNERYQRLSEEVFRHFSYRQSAFGNWYPFTVNADLLTPKARSTDRTTIYSSLLAYSRLAMFAKSHQVRFAANFERLSIEAVRGLFVGWNVIHFGKGGGDRNKYGSKFKVAIRALAKSMKDEVIERYVREIPENDTADGGIDVVALNDLADDAAGIPVYFGQCAAQQKGWPEKKFESHSLNLEKYISFFHKPGALLIIPLMYRNPNGAWISGESHQTILLDRLRITRLLEARGSAGAIEAALATVHPELMPHLAVA